MKNIREIVLGVLVDNLNLDVGLLSNIEYTEPVSISLHTGEEIYIYIEKEILHAVIEIDTQAQDIVSNQSLALIDAIKSCQHVFLNIQEDKLVLLAEISVTEEALTTSLTTVLEIFNNMVVLFKT
ncbi:MAG: hypothetical protein ACRC53_02580 [Plesiomonas sp.]|uniref:hypothetical protein n=1 Tax=Plesiomonas sp. TaxID=2486279 RepID=UPI003F3B8DCC